MGLSHPQPHFRPPKLGPWLPFPKAEFQSQWLRMSLSLPCLGMPLSADGPAGPLAVASCPGP